MRPVAGLVAGLIGLVLLAVLVTLAEIVWYGTRSDPHPADAAIVLGAAVYRSVPSPVFEERIRHAVGLYRAGRVRKLLMTGGLSPGDRLSEAEAARDWSIAQGVPAGDVLLEDRSRTTEENLAFAAPILAQGGLRRVLLVSDPLHMRRAMAHAHTRGLDAHPSPTGTSRYTGWRSWSTFLVREAYFLTRCRIARSC